MMKMNFMVLDPLLKNGILPAEAAPQGIPEWPVLEIESAVGLMLLGVIIFMGICHLVLYAFRPREIAALYFALGCFIGAVRWLDVEGLLPPGTYMQLIRDSRLFAIAAGIYSTAGVLLALRRDRDGALLPLLGVSCLVSALVFDRRPVVLIGLSLFVLALTIILARRFLNAMGETERMKERLLSQDKLYGELFANKSQELKTSLHSIMNLPRAMLDGAGGPVTAAQRSHLTAMAAESARLAQLIRDLLDASQRLGSLGASPQPSAGACAESTAAAEAAPAAELSQQPFTIVAAADAMNLQVIAAILHGEPYRIVPARDAEEALQLLDREDRADLLLIDGAAPTPSEYDAVRRLRRRYSPSELPVLLTAVGNEPEEAEPVFAAGVNDMLVKPFHAWELRARVRTLIAMKAATDAVARSESALLRRQIKPQFLQQTLHTIIGICPRSPQHAVRLLSELSRYLRDCFELQMKESFIPIARELELIRSYAALEKARFGDALKVAIAADEKAQAYIPPLSVLPLVENAVRHGALRRPGGGAVTVCVTQEGGSVAIEVSDNGEGMPPELLEELLQRDREARMPADWPGSGSLDRSGPGAGGATLAGIHRRLQRLYGTGLRIESAEGAGTKVTVTVPVFRL